MSSSWVLSRAGYRRCLAVARGFQSSEFSRVQAGCTSSKQRWIRWARRWTRRSRSSPSVSPAARCAAREGLTHPQSPRTPPSWRLHARLRQTTEPSPQTQGRRRATAKRTARRTAAAPHPAPREPRTSTTASVVPLRPVLLARCLHSRYAPPQRVDLAAARRGMCSLRPEKRPAWCGNACFPSMPRGCRLRMARRSSRSAHRCGLGQSQGLRGPIT
mmetsp:Transcript_29038/g.74678  ORF Transcript_29038/g.74678 Transcript_29038/m.74678 type:complete len:216 (-) Transcript_29038:572-1219(-)